jgi:NADPH:quinone reductase-like Zn-dependent oxidoreductase
MRAVGVVQHGGPDALEVVELPEVHAGPGQVRLRVHAATVNPTDTYQRNGAFAATQAKRGPPPYVPGMDAAGVVDEIGEGVTHLAVGDRAMAIVQPSGNHGAYASSVVLPGRSVTHAPAGTSHVEASTLPMNALTARLSLDRLALAPGQTLAVTGAAGCYGGYVVQLAKADGLHVIADASHADRKLVEELGADIVLERGEGLADGAITGDTTFSAVRDGGAIAVVRGQQGEPGRGITVHDIWVRDYLTAWEKLDTLRRQVEDGQVTLRVAATYPAENADEAHRRLEAGGTRGRLVLEF